MVAGAPTSAAQSAPVVASRITARIDESQLVTLKGSIHPLANARNDRGAAPESMPLQRMHLVLSRSDEQETSLRQLINDMHTPGTASYHKWLTPDQFGKQFGPSDEDISKVETWLTGHGFNVTKVNPGKQTIEFSGSVAQLRNTFHTQIHKYEVNGEAHYANANPPQIPAALAPVVAGFVALNNFRPRSYIKELGKAAYNPKTGTAQPEWTIGPGSPAYQNNYVLSPADYAVQYDLSPLYTGGVNGSGQAIAIINESNVNIGLVNQFRTLFGLPANPPQVIIDGNDPGVDGINNSDGPNYASGEAYLDVEWAGAVAPNATVDLVIASDTELQSGLILAAEHAVYSNVAPIMSLSFGACESAIGSTNAFLNTLYEQAAAQGITVLVSTGDSGSAGCDNDNAQEYAVSGQAVSGFASTPYNVAVGGTDFYYSSYNQGSPAINTQLGTYWNTTPSNSAATPSIKGVIPEQPWNDSQFGLNLFSIYNSIGATSIAGASGGESSLYTKPSWQKGTGVPGDGMRDIPDVSLFAANGLNASFYPVCSSDGDCQPASTGSTVQISGVGGTSASTPSFAGIMALVNQQYGRQGLANFVLYPLATQFPAAFHDVVNGTNSVPCQEGSPDCIAPFNPFSLNGSTVSLGQIGTGTTPEYDATTGYDLASGLGTVDANVLVTDWNKVTFASTTTTLTPSKTTFAHGTAVTLNGSVMASSGTPTGQVALVTGSTDVNQQALTSFPLSGGSYSGIVSNLPGGTYNIWGYYSGDSTNAASSSQPTQINVTSENSTLSLAINGSATSPGTSIPYGTQLLLSAQPKATSTSTGIPSGTVIFSDGSAAINTAVITAQGDAEYNPPFAVGSHSISAKYSGDQSYNASSSAAPITFTIAKDTPNLFVGASNVISSPFVVIGGPNQPTVVNVLVEDGAISTFAQNNGFLAPVPVAAPTGSVTLSGSGLPSGFAGTQTLKATTDPSTGAPSGIVIFTIPASNSAASYNVTISYAGDSNYASTSASGTIQVQTFSDLATTTTATLSGSVSPTTTIIVTGTVTGQSGKAAPTGSVFAFSSGNQIAGAGLSPSSTTDVSSYSMVLNSQNLVQGSNIITIQYTGDNTYLPSAVQITNPVSNPLSDFTLVPQTPIVAVAAPGGSGTVPINVASVNGFSGSVALTATAKTGIGIQLPVSVTLTANASQTVNLMLTPSVALGSGTFNVLLTGTDSTGKYVHTLGLQLVVGGTAAATPTFTLSNSGNINITAGATTGNTSTITVTPLAGLTGAVNLSCAVTPSGANSPACSLPSSVTIAGTAAQTATLTVTTTDTTSAGAYTVTVTGNQGTITQTTAVTVNVTAAFALSNSGSINVTAGATTGNTSTVTVTPSNGFTGGVSLTCSVAGPSGATSPATCSLASSSVTITGTAAQTDVLTVATKSTTSAGAYTVTVTGNQGTTTETTTVTVNVTAAAAPSFALTNSGNISVSPGATTGNTSTITVTPSNGFTGAVDLTCAVTGPSGATDPATCTLASSSVTISGTTAQTDVLTANTTASTASLGKPAGLFWPSTGGAVLALVLFFGIPARRRVWRSLLALLFFVGVLGALSGCGGGSSSSGGGSGGTTAGTYTITVTGTMGTITQTTVVSLTVQ